MPRSLISCCPSEKTACWEPKTISRPTRTERGFTLLELLAVLTLFSILMGIGVGAFRKVSLGRAMAVSQVKDALRAARLFAIEQSSGARVEIDPEANTIQACGFVSTGNWHFEDEVSRGWPTNAVLLGDATLIEDGAIGRGLRFGAEVAGQADLGRSVSFDSDRGIQVELFVRLRQDSAGTVIQKGDAFRLGLTDSRTLACRMRVREGHMPGTAVAGVLSLETEDRVPWGRWVRIGMTYDGTVLSLLIDGRARKSVKNPEPLFAEPDPAATLLLGASNAHLTCDVDEVRLSSIVVREAPPLPDGVTFSASGTIYFDARGRLDPAYHTKPLTVTLVHDEQRRNREIVVGLLGEIR
ncbi:MAG: LamG-like jellyroll fold domain-containing protein [Planctomycetota bacterium]